MAQLLRPPPDHVAQQYYQQVVCCNGAAVEVRLDAGGGRGKGLFATAPLEPGGLVLQERPLAGMQELDNRTEAPACGHCFQPLGSLERQVGARLCGTIAGLSRALEGGDDDSDESDEEQEEEERQAAQQRLLQIQEHVSPPLLEGLMEGTHTLPVTHLVPLPHPVPCARGCGEEYCSAACRDAAWQRHHCLLCLQGPAGSSSAGGSSSSSSSSIRKPMGKSKGSSRGAGSSSSRAARPPGPEEVAPGVAVDRAALQHFIHLASETNDILLLAARVLAGAALEAGQLAAAAAGGGGKGDAAASGVSHNAGGTAPVAAADHNNAGDSAAAAVAAAVAVSTQQPPPLSPDHSVHQALLPWAVAHKGLWWEVAGAGQVGKQEGANPDEVDEAEELAAQIKELVSDAAALLRGAWPRLPGRDTLLTTEVLGQLIGLFELNNLALNVPSPVTRYFESLEDPEALLRQDERESAAAECFGLKEALGEEAGQGVEGTAFYALHSCINHSCRPNAEAACRPDGLLQIVALRPIAAGEEVVISYVDESEAYEARARVLRDYGFSCGCEACLQEAGQE